MNPQMLLKSLGIHTPEQASVLFEELRKANASKFDGMNRPIQKDATDNIGVTSPLGLQGAPLQVPAKLLYPSLTPLRNRLARGTTGGLGFTYREITGINTTKIWPSVAEATDSTTGRNTRIAFNEANVTKNYKTLEMENMLTPEAQFGSNSSITPGQDFDAAGFADLALLQAMMRSHALDKSGFQRVTRWVIGLTCWLLLVHLIEISVWGLFYFGQGCMPDAESAFYFSGVTYTTVGYGDLVLPKAWRMLAPLEAMTGILMCGLSTGLFFALVSRWISKWMQSRTASEPAPATPVEK